MTPPETDSLSGTLALWIGNGLVASLILARLALRKQGGYALTLGDAWVAVALVFNGLRSESSPVLSICFSPNE